MKKAEGLSLSVVVIAAVALVVLVVLILIFSGRIGLFNTGLKECPPGTTGMTQDQLKDFPDGTCDVEGTLPKKVIGEGTTLKYCCPE